MNPCDEGIALRCDEDGIVQEVVRDALQLADRVPPGASIVALADTVDVAKARNFLHELQQKRAAFDWEISVGGPAGLQTMHFAGGEIEGGFLVIVARTRGGLELLNTELMRINNEQMNALRSASREVARLNETSKYRRRGDESVYDELTQVNNELTNLQREMAKANAELAQLNEQKNRLLGMAAHDLRSPLGAILSFSEFLQADAGAGFSEEHREFIAIIHSSSEFMLNLINDLLDVSSIESGQLKLNLGPGELAELVARSVSLNRVLAQKKGITIDYAVPSGDLPPMLFDSGKIEQVLNNLLGNAIKFSHAGTAIEVSVQVGVNAVTVAVRDQGQGIPADELSRLFRNFGTTRVRGTAGEPSTGLGLAIARKIVEGHGGTVAVDSTVGQGSTFSFSLPTLDI
jgi:signal transduction histidine kinase